MIRNTSTEQSTINIQTKRIFRSLLLLLLSFIFDNPEISNTEQIIYYSVSQTYSIHNFLYFVIQ